MNLCTSWKLQLGVVLWIYSGLNNGNECFEMCVCEVQMHLLVGEITAKLALQWIVEKSCCFFHLVQTGISYMYSNGFDRGEVHARQNRV